MKKLRIEEIKVGITAGGMACGPIPGHVVAEIRYRDENDNVHYRSMEEVESMPFINNNDESWYDRIIDEDADELYEDDNYDSYESYDDLYEMIGSDPDADRLLTKLLAYVVRVDWPEVKAITEACTGKCIGEFEIPVCDAEQEYLDGMQDGDEDDK